MTLAVVEFRCPNEPRQLLFKLRQSGEVAHVTSENLLEITCRDCARSARRLDPSVFRVLHLFDLTGTLIESVIEY